MLKVDSICLIVFGVCLLFGLVFGFGKGLRFISKGWSGRIISLIFCYVFFGLILSIPFVQTLINNFLELLDDSNWFFKVLKAIRIELVVFAIVLFIVVQIVRKLLFEAISKIMEADTTVIKVLNKLLGVVLYFGLAFILLLIVLQILTIGGGATVENSIFSDIEGSIFKIDQLFLNNPLNSIIESIKSAKM